MDLKTPKQLIPGLLASAEARSTITQKQPNAKWLAKWLHLQTDHHPKLRELENAVGRFCSGIWNNPGNGYLLLLVGENGTGKTHCANAVDYWVRKVGHGNEYIPRLNHKTYVKSSYFHWPKFLDRLKEGNWDLVDDAIDAGVLILDELGGGHDPSRVGVDKLCQILSRRENAWTLITTNLTPLMWEEAFDRRVASRFFRNSEIVDLTEVPDFALVTG